MYQKYKQNISKRAFYSYVAILAVLSLVLIVWIAIPYTVGFDEQFIEKLANASQNQNKEQAKYEIIASGKLAAFLSYIANSFTLLFFLFYITMARHRLTVGYGFYVSWIIIFVTLIAMPFYQGTERHVPIALGIGGLITGLSSLMVLALLINLFQYYVQRKAHYYEWYKIHIGKAR
ncbi:hypothetical protein ACJA23_03195 [Mycoplasma corogypsi]|uniref:hypothetical protein n=1 Tax=Mycoplasma corogypsi TaxID=2106 RepID=UPI003872B927